MSEPYREWEAKTRREDAWLASRPVCEMCGHPIQSRKLFDYDGVLFHRSCFIDEFEKETEDYIS